MTSSVEIAKQTSYVLVGQSYSVAVTKQSVFGILAYPTLDIAKQLDLVLLQDPHVVVGKQVVYALLATPPKADSVAFTATGSFSMILGKRGLLEMNPTGTLTINGVQDPPWDCTTDSPDPDWTCN